MLKKFFNSIWYTLAIWLFCLAITIKNNFEMVFSILFGISSVLTGIVVYLKFFGTEGE